MADCHTCYQFYINVDNKPENGCDINLLSDDNHCGKLNNKCIDSNSDMYCAGGQCYHQRMMVVVPENDHLNLRKGQGDNYDIQAEIPPYTYLDIPNYNGNKFWQHTSYHENSGYVGIRYIMNSDSSPRTNGRQAIDLAEEYLYKKDCLESYTREGTELPLNNSSLPKDHDSLSPEGYYTDFIIAILKTNNLIKPTENINPSDFYAYITNNWSIQTSVNEAKPGDIFIYDGTEIMELVVGYHLRDAYINGSTIKDGYECLIVISYHYSDENKCTELKYKALYLKKDPENETTPIVKGTVYRSRMTP